MGTACLKFIHREEKKEKMGNCLKKSSSSFEVQNPALVKPRDSIDGVTFIRRDSFVEKDIEQHARSWFYQHFTNTFFCLEVFFCDYCLCLQFWVKRKLAIKLWNVGGCLLHKHFTGRFSYKSVFHNFSLLIVCVCNFFGERKKSCM